MTGWRSIFGRGPNATMPRAPSTEVGAARPAAEQPAQADLPPAEHAPVGGRRAPGVEQASGQRGNFAAILSAQKAGAPVGESPSSLAALTRGEAFPLKQAAALREVTGHELTRAGLEQLYGSALPDAHVFVGNITTDRYTGAVEFSVDWMDNEGAVVARLNRRLARHQDGDLELYSHGCWVEPSHRSRAVSAAVMQREVELLSNLSAHPKTRLSLWAGGMKDPNNPDDFQPLGVYVWATMGFDCAQNHVQRSRLSRGGGKARCDVEAKSKELQQKPDFELMKHMFGVWVDAAAERGMLPRDPAVLRDLKQAALLCKNMWSLATLQVPGLDVQVDIGGRRSACHVGKAFLLSQEAPRWEGVFLVHDRPDDFAAIADEYCRPRVAQATATFEQLQGDLAKLLDGDDLLAKQHALANIGRTGDARWAPVLEQVMNEEPELKADAQAALHRVTGARLTEAMAEQAQDSALGAKARTAALTRYAAWDPEGANALMTALMAGPRTASDFEVAEVAMKRLVKRAPAGVLPTVVGLYDHALRAQEVKDPAGGGYRSFTRVKEDTRTAVIEQLTQLQRPDAQAALLKISREDPSWEVAEKALTAWAQQVGPHAPQQALAEVQAFLTRARAAHTAAKPNTNHPDPKVAASARDLQSRLSWARKHAIATLAAVPAPGVADALVATMAAEPYWDGVGKALLALAKVLGPRDPGQVVGHAERLFGQANNYAPMRTDCVDALRQLPLEHAGPALVRLAQHEQERQVLRSLQDGLRDCATPGAGAARQRVEGRLAALEAELKARYQQTAPRAGK